MPTSFKRKSTWAVCTKRETDPFRIQSLGYSAHPINTVNQYKRADLNAGCLFNSQHFHIDDERQTFILKFDLDTSHKQGILNRNRSNSNYPQ
jgi:hypothetical protein